MIVFELCRTLGNLGMGSNSSHRMITTRIMPNSVHLVFAFLLVHGCLPTEARAQSIRNTALTNGQSIGAVYEAYLSPHQEPGEEKDTPSSVPKQFQSSQPSKLRSERDSEGYGRLSFQQDLSKAFIEVKIAGIDIESINMFHIHCGRPDQLGPILVDFALVTDIQANLRDDGIFAVEITNEDILAVLEEGKGLIAAFTSGCPIVPGGTGKVKTVAGMEYIAQRGELYFNLHTKGQTYFGDIRGRITAASPESTQEAKTLLTAGIPTAPAPTQVSGHRH